jgi:hypothetical protein
VPTIFEKLGKHRTAATHEEKTQQPKERAQALLNWLLRWPKPILTANDIRNYGPRPKHNRESAINTAQILVAHGHLTPLAAHKWKIIREPLISTHRQ